MSRPKFYAVWSIVIFSVFAGCQSFDLNSSPIEISGGSNEQLEIASSFSKSDLLFSSARKFENAGQIEEAIKLYEKALKSTLPKAREVEANRHLAILYDLSDQSEKARTSFEFALQNGTTDANLLNDYGYFLLNNNDAANATKLLRGAYEQFPEDKRIANNLGIALVTQGQTEAGYRVFESVVGQSAAASNVGAILIRQGMIEDGKAWLAKAGNKDSEVASVILELANQNRDSVRRSSR